MKFFERDFTAGYTGGWAAPVPPSCTIIAATGANIAADSIFEESRDRGNAELLASKFSGKFTGEFTGAQPPVNFIEDLLDRWLRKFATEFINF